MAIIGNKSIKELVGEITSDKVSNTRVVLVKRVKVHPIYKKRFVVRKKYYAQDDNNQSKIGDTVRIREDRPLSKLKKWRLIEVVTSV